MSFQKGILATVLVNFAVTVALAGNLSVTTPYASPNEPLEWDLGNPSPVMTIDIENTTSTVDHLWSWSLGLEIIPDVGATGMLQFNSVGIPDNYWEQGMSSNLAPPFAGPSSTISVIGDTETDSSGVEVPESGNLLNVDFDASSDPMGLFHIRAVPGQFAGSNWFSDDFLTARDFLNIPFDGGPVIIGSINVVPEPSTITMLIGMLGGSVLFLWRRRRINV